VTDETQLRDKAEALAALRRAGVPPETIRALDGVLEDPVDLARDADVLARYGITRDRMVDAMGGSL
jgi:crotonobetainyl-CoA:carnitine CoA-transferase CaiB-like acyl-CoA transferase